MEHRSGTSTAAPRNLALIRYLEGLGLRSIGRLLGFSHVAVYQWMRALGEQVDTVRSAQPARIVELDEMHSDVGQKNHGRLWIAVDRLGKRFVHAVTGSRGVDTGRRLWADIDTSDIDSAMTDHWEPYA